MSPLKKHILNVLFILLCDLPLYAQYVSVDNYTGYWKDNLSWQEGIPPGVAGQSDDMVINSNITVDTTLKIGNYRNLYIHDTLVVMGDLIAGNGSSVTIGSDGILIVMGDYLASSLFTFLNDGMLVVTDEVDMSILGVTLGTGRFITDDGTPDFGVGTLIIRHDPVSQLNNNGNARDQAIYDFVMQGGEGSLPLEMTYFQAQFLHNRVNLSWGTFKERDTDYFELYRRSGEGPFKLIHIIKCKEESVGITKYEVWDSSPSLGENYYKLRLVNLDGLKEEKGTVFVWVPQGLKDFIIYPNPVKHHKISFKKYRFRKRRCDGLSFSGSWKTLIG